MVYECGVDMNSSIFGSTIPYDLYYGIVGGIKTTIILN